MLNILRDVTQFNRLKMKLPGCPNDAGHAFAKIHHSCAIKGKNLSKLEVEVDLLNLILY